MTIAKQHKEEVKMTGSNYEGFYKSGIIEDEIMKREWTLNDILDINISLSGRY